MTDTLRNHFNKTIKLVVFIVFIACLNAEAGSYDDFFRGIKRDDARVIQQLLNRGFDPNTEDPELGLGLNLAIQEPSLQVARTLIAWPKTRLNLLSSKGESPLMVAALKGELDLAARMIKRDADVNKTGWTPLHYAATSGHVDVISLLLEHHAYIDAESPNGSTPLMMACMYGSTEAVKLLLDQGADVSVKNQQGLTALDFAEQGERPDAERLVKSALRAKRPQSQW